jgi:hypothetical protein
MKIISLDIYKKENFFTGPFINKANELIIEINRTKGKLLKVFRFGKAKDAILPQFHKFFPQTLLDATIIFCTKVNGQYVEGAIGVDPKTGELVVTLDPDNPQIVKTFLHEAKHEMDKLKGKRYQPSNTKNPYASPEERRARHFEDSFHKIYDKSNQKISPDNEKTDPIP